MLRALRRAIERNDTNALLSEILVSDGFRLRQAINIAIKRGSKECVEILLNERVELPRFYIETAVKSGNKDIIEMFLRTRPDTNELRSGLLAAVRSGNIGFVEMLLASRWRADGPDIPGANPNECRAGGLTALDHAVKNGYIEIVRLLVEHGAKTGTQYLHGKMQKAIVQNDTKYVKYLTDLDVKDGFFLRLAALHCEIDMVRILLDSKVDVNSSNAGGRTALMFAAMRGRDDIVRLLIRRGADVNAIYRGTKESRGHTALMWAVGGNYEMVVNTLLRAGVDVDAKSSNGETAYDMAVRHGFHSIATTLNSAKQMSFVRAKTAKLRLKRKATDNPARNRLWKRRRRRRF